MSDGRARPEVELFTQAHCSSCRRVEQFLRERGVEFTSRDVGEDPAALDELTARGYMSTPVTRIGEHWVAGFRKREFARLL